MSTFMNSVQKLVARHTTRSLAAAAGLAAMIATSGHAAPSNTLRSAPCTAPVSSTSRAPTPAWTRGRSCRVRMMLHGRKPAAPPAPRWRLRWSHRGFRPARTTPSNHWAAFDGQHAVGASGLMRISGNLVFSAGFAVGLDNGRLLSLTNRTQTEFGTSMPAVLERRSQRRPRGLHVRVVTQPSSTPQPLHHFSKDHSMTISILRLARRHSSCALPSSRF